VRQPVGARARFDDLVAGSALTFDRPDRILTATDAADVLPLLAEVEQATRSGRWAFGYLAYEAAAGLDPRSEVVSRPAPDGVPLALFALSDAPAEAAPVVPQPGIRRDYAVGPWKRDWTEQGYRDDVARVREFIAAGETYQLNLTVRMRAPVEGDLEQLYADLAWGQRGSYAALLDLGRFVVASASPELFFEWTADELRTRPMKGTAPRGRTTTEDVAQRARLVGSEKERAENLMIVDLIRNDLGRLAEAGSVRVPALFTPERYETVWQLTSDVTARTRSGTTLTDVFSALFPSGSVTGAPKLRAMELIAGLEATPRGVYCGAIGMVAPAGHPWRARFSVAIRTLTVDRSSGEAVFGTGGGITWGSDPATWIATSRGWRTRRRTSASPSTARRSGTGSPQRSTVSPGRASAWSCPGTGRATSASDRSPRPRADRSGWRSIRSRSTPRSRGSGTRRRGAASTRAGPSAIRRPTTSSWPTNTAR
jgi:para-aminobenzoate synthetase/4-amino-4-deoxychorismate lyase